MSDIKARLDRLNSFRLAQKGDIPPVDSVAFQMRLLVMPTLLGEASWLNADERAAALALNPLDYEEGYSRDTVLEAQEIIRRENTQKGKL